MKDDELNQWQQQWRSQSDVPADLIERVARGRRTMLLGRVAEILVTVLIGGWIAIWAVISRDPNVILLAVGTWVFIALAWVVSLRYSKGLWAASESNTAAYVDLCVQRCRAELKSLRAIPLLGLPFIAFTTFANYRILTEGGTPADLIPLLAMPTIAVAAVLGLPALRGRKVRAELASLLKLEQELKQQLDLDRTP